MFGVRVSRLCRYVIAGESENVDIIDMATNELKCSLGFDGTSVVFFWGVWGGVCVCVCVWGGGGGHLW